MATDLTPTVEIDRRALLAAAGAGFLATLAPRAAEALDRGGDLYAAACRKPDGGFALALFTGAGEVVRLTDLPDRGHGLIAHIPSGRLVTFARRPGTFAVVSDVHGAATRVIVAEEGRHFYGHGDFSPDGRLLYTTENDYDAARGVIGIYDTTDGYRRLGEFPSGGVGPHELALAPDGRTLVIANGGIETHPDYGLGRTKLNIPTMRPNIALVDTETGEIRETHELGEAHRLLSIRHFAFDEAGNVWFGCQGQGPERIITAPLGLLKPGEGAAILDLPEEASFALRNYVGSMSANADGSLVAASSSVGHVVVVLETATGRVTDTFRRHVVSGVAPDGDRGLLATTGEGVIAHIPDDGSDVTARVQFDIHALHLPGWRPDTV